MSWSVSKSVNISEFPTEILIKELYNRIGDFMHDEEPRHEPHLESQPITSLQALRESLLRVYD